MAFAIGLAVAVGASVFARVSGFDRDRAYYPTILVVVGHYYVLFAAMGGSMRALILESIVMGAFAAAAVLGFKRSVWLVVAGLAAHGVFDFFHANIVTNPGVPLWWPAFCGAFDVAAAGCLAFLSLNSRAHTAKGFGL